MPRTIVTNAFQRDSPSGAELVVYLAKIIQYHPAYNFYTVSFAKGGIMKKAIPCGNIFGYGPSFHHIYTPGTLVIVTNIPGQNNIGARSDFVYILGAFVSAHEEKAFCINSQIDTFSNVGYVFDKLYNISTLQRPRLLRPVMYGSNAPIDALSGDFTIQTLTGAGILIDDWVAYLKSGDRCGLWLFRLDEHARLFAKTFELQTYAKEEQHIFQRGEIGVIDRIALYPWESLGALDQKIPVGKKVAENISDPINPPKSAKIITVQEDQLPYFRIQSFYGTFANIYQRSLSFITESQQYYTKKNAPDITQGVFKESLNIDGRYVLQSAKGIHLERSPLIITPILLQNESLPSEESENKSEKNDTPSQENIDIETSIYAKDHQIGLASLSLRGCSVNLNMLKNLRSKKDKWSIPTEDKLPFFKSKLTLSPPQFDPTLMWQQKPTHQKFILDKSQGALSTYFGGRAAIDLCDDGSVVISDAWGSQIILSRGNIVLTAPGDVYIAPGRSVITLAPQDCVLRAGNSVDISATTSDVTIKAQNNLKMLGGLSESKGGVLIESRLKTSACDYESDGEQTNVGGLVFKSHGACATYARWNSIVTEEECSIQSQKNLFFTSKQTLHLQSETSAITAKSRNILYYFGNDSCILGHPTIPEIEIGAFDTSIKNYNVSLKTDFKFQSPIRVFVSGEMYTTNIVNFLNIKCQGSIDTLGPGVFGGGVFSPDGGVSAIQPTYLNSLRKLFAILFEDAKPRFEAMYSVYKYILFGFLYVWEKLTESDSMLMFFNNKLFSEKVRFTFRTDDNYRISQFSLGEWQWQYYQKMYGSTITWVENEVPGPTENRKTAPWPGTLWNSGKDENYVTSQIQSLKGDVQTLHSTHEINGDPITQKASGAPAFHYVVNAVSLMKS